MYRNNQDMTKSRFMTGLQCLKAIHLQFNSPELKKETTLAQQSIINNGLNVGKIAQGLFPSGYDLSRNKTVWGKDLIESTQSSLQAKKTILFEAAFSTEHQRLFAQADILIKDDSFTKIIEVKSTTSVEDEHIFDLAYQVYVIQTSGYNHPLQACIAHLDNTYVRGEEHELDKLFKIVDVTDRVMALQGIIKELLIKFMLTIHLDEIPTVSISEDCFHPRQCPFFDHCWKNIPKNAVFSIGGIRKKKSFQLYNNGMATLDQLSPDVSLTNRQWIEVEAARSKKTILDIPKLKMFLDAIQGPLIYMDFESFMPPVPLFRGTKPYQQICFQFSVSRVDVDGKREVIDFVATPGSDPRRKFVEELIAATKGKRTIIVYNKSFEITRLRELQVQLPEYANALEDIISRVHDLMIPFAQRWFYNYQQGGSHSIKKVLPILAGDLSYHDLSISNGEVAMAAYYNLVTKTNYYSEERMQKVIFDLKRYCSLDVEAMVRIKEALETLTKNK